MQKILRKRVIRDLKENLFRYLALGLLIILGMYIIVSLVGAADTIIIGSKQHATENCLEDGEFQVFVPLTEQEIEKLENAGITLESMFYLDFLQEDESTLRVYKNREEINLLELDDGRMPETAEEIALEKRYCEENDISLGDEIVIANQTYQVAGIGSVPDYEAPLKNMADTSVASKSFGVAFVQERAYEELKASKKSTKSEEYVYAYRLNGAMSADELKDKLKKLEFSVGDVEDSYLKKYWEETVGKKEYFDIDVNNLVQFMPAEDNPRVGAAADDQIVNKQVGLFAGVIIMILFTYVISVFVVHSIDKESSIIGALYALGVKRKELIRHYLMLPMIVTFFAGTIGTVLGYSKWGINTQMGDCYGYFSIPEIEVVYEQYLLIYGIIMPPVVAALVNYFVIRKRLNQPALRLIKGEQKKRKERNIDLGNMGFISRFRIRQMLRELRTSFTVWFGMFVSLLIMMIGINCYALCEHIRIENKEDTKYEYMYTYKYPEEEVAEGGEACYAKTLKKEILGYNLEVTVLGIDEDNPYFAAKPKQGKSIASISSAMAQKYDLSVGDKVILTDEEEEMDYAFTVQEIVQYSPGFYVFMDIDSARELFGQEDDYYNVVFSDKELEIDSGRLYAVTSKTDIEKSASIFSDMMMPMISMLCVVSALIFIVVMYLMMKVMIDRSSFGISLMKIFGYRTKEIRKLYLNGNFYTVAVGALVCLPLAKWLMDAMYPMMIANISCGMNLQFTWQMYVGIYMAILVLYFIINWALVGHLKKMVPAEVLKNRE